MGGLLAGIAILFGIMQSLTSGERSADPYGPAGPTPPRGDDPDPLASFAGPLRAQIPVEPQPASYDRQAQYQYAPQGPYANVKPPVQSAQYADYDRQAQYQYAPQGPYAGVKPPLDASGGGITPLAPQPELYDRQAQYQYEPQGPYAGIKPPLDASGGAGGAGGSNTTLYDSSGAPIDLGAARAARELAVHLSTRPRASWDRAIIRRAQAAMGARVDGLIGPETRALMARFGHYAPEGA